MSRLTIAQVAQRRRQRVLNARGWRALVGRVLFLALVGYLLLTQVFLIRQNSGQGMFPALKDGDLCIAFRTAARELTGERYARDDVVIFTVRDATGAAPLPANAPALMRVKRFAVGAWEDLKADCLSLYRRVRGEPWPTRDRLYTGRVIATAGDVVSMSDSGTLLVNGTVQGGEIMYPTYVRGDLEYPYRVPEGCAYILGDYRTNTEDSRDFGPIFLENIEGKIITILRRRSL